MRDLRGHLVAILSGVAMLIVGISLLFSVVGLRAGMAEFSTVVTGLITSAYFAGYVAGVFFCPALITRVGHIRAFAAMASIASTMPILHAVWINPWFWGGLRLVTGICLVGLYIVIESWLNTLAPKDQRGRVFSMYLLVSFMALAVGQWLILVGDSVGFLPFAMVSVLLSFALLPITLAPVTQPDAVEPPRLSISSLWHTTPLGVSGAFASGLIHSAFFGLGALFAQRVGLDSAGVASFMAATILGGAIFQWPVGHLSDRIDRRLVLLSALLIAAVLSLLAYSSSLSWTWALVPIGVALGGVLFTVYGLSVAHANDMVDVSRTLEVTGGLLLVHGIGAAIGPTLAGLLMDAGGPGSLMLYFSAVCAVLAVHVLLRIRAVPPVAVEDKVGYVVVGSGMESALQQLDPRTPDPSEHDMAVAGDADAIGDVAEQPS
ncbi:MAG: MFS transporter [Burkholderiales bacterium]|jgi:MFS family permease|nr:putative MFS-type transporter YcaD [Betaproteobacteria bacterium MOLA814]